MVAEIKIEKVQGSWKLHSEKAGDSEKSNHDVISKERGGTDLVKQVWRSRKMANQNKLKIKNRTTPGNESKPVLRKLEESTQIRAKKMAMKCAAPALTLTTKF